MRVIQKFLVAILMGMTTAAPLLSHAADEHSKRPEAAPQSQRSDMEAMHEDVMHLRGLRGKALEQTFLTMMMDHHQSGIDMAKMAEHQAASPSVRRLAHKIVMEQQGDIALMRGYLSKWYGNPATAKADPRMHDMMQKTAVLKGPAFDRAFLRGMTEHHMSAIQMSQIASAHAPHAALRRFAAHIVSSQSREQAYMRQLMRKV